jgi:C-terminal processing protease CtpA/Prc
VLDVRDGGGSLSTVVDIAGLYRAGPIVQIKSAGRKKRFCMIEIKKLNGMGR